MLIIDKERGTDILQNITLWVFVIIVKYNLTQSEYLQKLNVGLRFQR